MQDRLAGFAVVLGAVLIAAVPCRALDLSGAVIVPLPAEGVVSKAAEMLQEELAARSGLTLSIATEAPETGSAILLGTAQTLPGVNVPEKPEAYGIAVDGNRVRLAGRDERGALFAAGRLIRLASAGPGTLSLELAAPIATAPDAAYRAHQLGYRHTANTYDAWTIETYEQYIRDLILFGSNGIELITNLDPQAKDGPVMAEPMRAMNVKLSALTQAYGIDLWLWSPVMAEPGEDVTTPEGKGYCIDQREVTQGEYFEFLYAYLEDPTVSSKRKEGAPDWPKAPGCEIPRLMPDFIGDIDCDTTPDAFSQKNMRQHHPIACVNWCNAYSYCAWAGKRLCGRVGGSDGDASNASGLADANQSEFYNVCSQGGKTAYAYGDDYRADIMSSGDIAYYKDGYAPDRAAAEADAPTDCHGAIAPFDAVVNVGCNVAEWQDGCSNSVTLDATCVAHGYAHSETTPEKSSRCDAFLESTRSQRSPQIGFRCCHD